MRAFPDTAYVSVPAVTAVRGVDAVEPVLRVSLKVVSCGLPDGAGALFVVTGMLTSTAGATVDLGAAEPVLARLGVGGPDPRTKSVEARWRLSPAGVERLEQARAGGGFTLEVNVEYGLMGGTGAPDWRQPERPIRVPWPDQPTQVLIQAHEWVRDVLEPWRQAAAVSLVVALPRAGATDDHRVIVKNLAEARRQLDAGEWKASVTASREACDQLRKMRPAQLHTDPKERGLAEREAAILDRLRDLTRALFDYGSASVHPDPVVRDIAWNREDAVLALGTAASMAQVIFART